MTRSDDIVANLTKAGRVCPNPQQWSRLWEMLPDRRRVGSRWEPPAPLILVAWYETTDSEKRERFRAHLLWAEERGCLDRILAFLNALDAVDWYTGS